MLQEELRAVQRREAAVLALQRDRRLAERRKARSQREKQLSVSLSSPGSAWKAVSLAELEDAAFRPGSLRQQLDNGDLSPLGRWFIQLKLLEHEDNAAHQAERLSLAPTDTSGAVDGVGKQDHALNFFLAVLARDKRCFDVVYAIGDRVQDVLGEVHDHGVETAGAHEALCFSSVVRGVVCRVTCLRRGGVYSFMSSWHIAHLEDELQHYVTCQADVTEALRLITVALEAGQAQ